MGGIFNHKFIGFETLPTTIVIVVLLGTVFIYPKEVTTFFFSMTVLISSPWDEKKNFEAQSMPFIII